MRRVATKTSGVPQREDIGGLIVLHLYGSYRDMGRQQVEVLGSIARDAYDLHRADWSRLIRDLGTLARLADTVLPRFWMTAGQRYDDTGTYEEIAGIGNGLRVSQPAAWRGVFGSLGGATTTFVATHSATADGNAVLAKNSDWPDRFGRRPPVVTHYHPDNGDLTHVVAGWPLTPLGAAGLNEAGLALGLNFFNATQVLALGLPRWPYRRVLQKAVSVGQAVRMITSSPNRGMSGFVSLADAHGDIAMVECTPGDSEVFRPEGDWFAQSNHARTEKMLKYDRGRSLDSFTRRPAIEGVVSAHLGRITPQVASEILRDRSNSKYVNESTVANTSVFHSVIMHPASRTLWHSTARQPLAPFGELWPFTVGGPNEDVAPLPADPHYGTGMDHERAVIAEMRRAMRLFEEGSAEQAEAIFDRFAASGETLLQPHRLAWARARARWVAGKLGEAESILATLDNDDVPFDVRANALAARAQALDRLNRREEAVSAYRAAAAYLDAHSQYNDGLISPLRGRIERGLGRPGSGKMPGTPALQRIPA